MTHAILDIDGSHGEGGGQLVRTAVALAAITGRRLRLRNIRAGRKTAGLAPQHLAAVRAVAALSGAHCQGLELRSEQLEFTPGALTGGHFHFDIGTAGSITLVLQALLPVMLHAPVPTRVRIVGGTDVRAAPPIDYFAHVLLPLLAKAGATPLCHVHRRGYYPRGGGVVDVSAAPTSLSGLQLDAPGPVSEIAGHAHVANLPAHILDRMQEAATARLRRISPANAIASSMLTSVQATGQGGAIVLSARTEQSILGAACVAERGVRAETLGETAASELALDLDSAAAVDVHAADQLLIYAALAHGTSVFTTRELSLHARTAMWLIAQFLPVRFDVTDLGGLQRVEISRP
jgi:RNA 3'-phosphate cyclase